MRLLLVEDDERLAQRLGDTELELLIRNWRITVLMELGHFAAVDQEIARAASTMLAPKPDGTPDIQQWVKMVTEEQGVSLDVYRSDALLIPLALLVSATAWGQAYNYNAKALTPNGSNAAASDRRRDRDRCSAPPACGRNRRRPFAPPWG